MEEWVESGIKCITEQTYENLEIIIIDDGSKDATYEKIKHLAESEEDVYGINFSRNFGKESAISAGLANARGDCAVVIDCDLQHPPGKIVEM